MEDYFIDFFAIDLIKIVPSINILGIRVSQFYLELPSQGPFPWNSNGLLL